MQAQKENSKIKTSLMLMLTNVIEYYDFLLFAHLGYIITPLFFPNQNSVKTHILSLFLFGMSFIIRPIGGAIFGIMSDKYGRKKALILSVRWAVLPSILIALLPDYEVIGIYGSYIFIILRLMQGIALGGEYPVAGIYLMETNKNNQGLMSSIMVLSGSIGSLAGLGIAILCSQSYAPSWLWRIAFLLGGLAGLFTYYMRKNLSEQFDYLTQKKNDSKIKDPLLYHKWFIIFITSFLASVTMWIPATYCNFYVTKILHQSMLYGQLTTLVGIIFYIIALPIIGIIFDRIVTRTYMLSITIIICPVAIGSLYLLSHNHMVLAQIGLVINAALIGGPIHKLMYKLFPPATRGRNISFIYMFGLSFGGLFPSISSYIVDKTGQDIIPGIIVSIISLIVFISYYKIYSEKLNVSVE